jgi:hypothetical protein
MSPRGGTKIAAVIELLQRSDGGTLAEIIAATGWLPHTTRTALTGLRKRGYAIAVDRTDKPRGSVYRIEPTDAAEESVGRSDESAPTDQAQSLTALFGCDLVRRRDDGAPNSARRRPGIEFASASVFRARGARRTGRELIPPQLRSA